MRLERLIVLKICYFSGQSVSVAFSLHSFTNSPSAQGFDHFSVICSRAKLAQVADSLDILATINTVCCHCRYKLRTLNMSSLQNDQISLCALFHNDANCTFLTPLPHYYKNGHAISSLTTHTHHSLCVFSLYVQRSRNVRSVTTCSCISRPPTGEGLREETLFNTTAQFVYWHQNIVQFQKSQNRS